MDVRLLPVNRVADAAIRFESRCVHMAMFRELLLQGSRDYIATHQTSTRHLIERATARDVLTQAEHDTALAIMDTWAAQGAGARIAIIALVCELGDRPLDGWRVLDRFAPPKGATL